MRVLAFGTYERRYPRNAQVFSALRRAGVEVVERHVPVWDGREHKFAAGLGSAARLAAAELRLFRRPRDDFDVLLVGYPGHLDLPAARRAARGRPIVLNPLVSLWDSLVEDRGRFRAGSLPARALRAVDRSAFRAADLVVADTEEHARLFRALGARRVEVCFVGAEERVFKPGWRGGDRFVFVGKLIPLHGVETILEAARLAPDARVYVVGSGQQQRLLAERPSNVDWTPWLVYEQLPAVLRGSRAALGIFGTSAKAARVIPNKAFQALACGTPLITADTPAARELLVDGESALLVPAGDPQALAAALSRVAREDDLAQRLSEGGLAAYRARASEEVLGERWRGLLESLC
ncbi:MAG TPA: glycosyltransferase [Gaiellaceae bacterium]|jgi:glycosyltransferase involved in cell wall biosynthesis